jgi:hypothetical protein
MSYLKEKKTMRHLSTLVTAAAVTLAIIAVAPESHGRTREGNVVNGPGPGPLGSGPGVNLVPPSAAVGMIVDISEFPMPDSIAVDPRLSGPVALLPSGEFDVPKAGTMQPAPKPKKPQIDFDMVVSPNAAQCLPDAKADVRVVALEGVERMTVRVSGLPPETEFEFFVLQPPVNPFGLAWYQGDIETNEDGEG